MSALTAGFGPAGPAGSAGVYLLLESGAAGVRAHARRPGLRAGPARGGALCGVAGPAVVCPPVTRTRPRGCEYYADITIAPEAGKRDSHCGEAAGIQWRLPIGECNLKLGDSEETKDMCCAA